MTKTGGRGATVRHIAGECALSVGMPKNAPPAGWRWVALTDVARLESGHTPSRRHPEYWDGDIPWLSIRDAKAANGGTVIETIETTNEIGIRNSSARVLPLGTVCLSRTASVGYVTIMGRAMATSQDFVNWVCSEKLDQRFLQYLLICERPSLTRFSSGAVHQTIYFPEVKAFHVCIPGIEEQRQIVAVLDEAFAAIATATANAEKNLANARALFACTIEGILEGASGCQTMTLLAAADESCSLSYGIVQPGDEQAGGLPIVRPTDLQQKYIELGPLKRIAPDLASGYQRTKLRGDELLLCVRGTTGTLSIAAPELAGGNVTRGIVPIRFNPAILSQKLGYYLLLSASVQKQIKGATYGTALMQINIRDLKQLELRVPKLASQDALADRLDTAQRHAEKLQGNYSAKLDALTALKQSLLHRAFSGELTSKAAAVVALNDNFATPAFAAKIVAFAYERHVAKNRVRNFGTVKAEKILHMVEAIGGIDLGRQPLREAAGPDDAKRRHATWDWARSQHFFRFNKRSGGGHDFEKLSSYSGMIEDARTAIIGSAVEKAIDLLVDMDRDFAELIATTYAAWNNLIIDQCAATDGDIVLAARDKWHRDKLRFDPSRFHDAIRFIRKNSIVPDGTAKRVGGQEALLF